MEKRILDKLSSLLEASEARIIAAVGGAAPAYTAPAMASSPRSSTRQSYEVDMGVPAAPPPSPPVPQATAASRRGRTKTKEPEIITSTLANPDKKQWVAIPGIRSTSGVQCESSCKEGYNKVRLDRSGIRWVIFEFDKSMEWIYPTREGVQTEDYIEDWEGFVRALPDKKACYALYNFEYEDQGGSGYAMAGHNVIKNKMVLFAWTDSKCKVRDRMVAASSQSAIKQVCKGSCDCSVHDKPDMTYLQICRDLDCNVKGA